MAKHGKKSQEEVREVIHEFKRGRGPAKNRKQAIAIGLSKARKEGAQVPPPPKK